MQPGNNLKSFFFWIFTRILSQLSTIFTYSLRIKVSITIKTFSMEKRFAQTFTS